MDMHVLQAIAIRAMVCTAIKAFCYDNYSDNDNMASPSEPCKLSCSGLCNNTVYSVSNFVSCWVTREL